MIVSYYSIFLKKSILWLRCMYYSDESSRVKQGRGEGWLHKICLEANLRYSTFKQSKTKNSTHHISIRHRKK